MSVSLTTRVRWQATQSDESAYNQATAGLERVGRRIDALVPPLAPTAEEVAALESAGLDREGIEAFLKSRSQEKGAFKG